MSVITESQFKKEYYDEVVRFMLAYPRGWSREPNRQTVLIACERIYKKIVRKYKLNENEIMQMFTDIIRFIFNEKLRREKAEKYNLIVGYNAVFIPDWKMFETFINKMAWEGASTIELPQDVDSVIYNHTRAQKAKNDYSLNGF